MKKILQKIIVIILLGLTCFNAFSPMLYVSAATASEYELVKQAYIDEFLEKLNDIIDERYDYEFYTVGEEEYIGIIQLILQPSLTDTDGPYSDRFPEDISSYEWLSWDYVEEYELSDEEKDRLSAEVNTYISNFAEYGSLYNFLQEKKQREALENGVFNYEEAKAKLHELFYEETDLIHIGGDYQPWDSTVSGYLSTVESYKNKRFLV